MPLRRLWLLSVCRSNALPPADAGGRVVSEIQRAAVAWWRGLSSQEQRVATVVFIVMHPERRLSIEALHLAFLGHQWEAES